MRTYVWIDAWQQQCCGASFEVGSRVTWRVVPETGRAEWVTLLLGAEWGDRVRFREEHHDDSPDTITGTVVAMNVVTSRRALRSDGCGQAWAAVPGGGRLRSTDVADPCEPEDQPGATGELSFDGWIVELDGAYVSTPGPSRG